MTVDKPVGALVYTQMLNDKGGIECDLTVARVAHDEYYIVTGTGIALPMTSTGSAREPFGAGMNPLPSWSTSPPPMRCCR